MQRIPTAAALAILILPALVRAQEPVQSFEQLNTRLKVGDKIIVTDTQGREHTGKIFEISPSALTLDDHRTQKLGISDVQLVEDRPHDSFKNGALVGLGIGAGLAGLGVLACSGEDYCMVSGADAAALIGIYAGIGAAIGTGIDALIPGKKRVVYRAPDGKPSTRAMFTPVITPRTKSVALSIAF